MFNPIQIRLAFVDGKEAVRFYALAEAGPNWVRLEGTGRFEGQTGEPIQLRVEDDERLAAIVARDDLTTVGGRPLVVANLDYRLIGFCAGPPQVGAWIQILAVLSIADGFVLGLTPPPGDTRPPEVLQGGDPNMMTVWLLSVASRGGDSA